MMKTRSLLLLPLVVLGMALVGTAATTSALAAGDCSNAATREQQNATTLPDCRAYEMVTPPDLAGPARPPFVTGPMRHPWNFVSADGSSVLWSMFQKAPPGIDATGYDNSFTSRRGASGWTSTFVSPPGSKVLGGAGQLIWASSDLQRFMFTVFEAILDPTDHDPIDPTGPFNNIQYNDIYRRDADGTFARMTQGSLALPVGSESIAPADASSDGLDLVFSSTRQLEPDAAASSDSVYERSGNRTVVINKDEQGNLAPGSNGLAVSDDGNRVVFHQFGGSTLYLRDVAAEKTTVVAADLSGTVNFTALSNDGQRVVFVTTLRLSADDVDNSQDVYVYDVSAASYRRISAPTGSPNAVGPGNVDACSAPVGSCDASAVVVSRDGEQVYFTSAEQLDGNAGVAGARNLYLSDRAGVHFVATVDPSDPLGNRVRFTPDESKLIFESRAAVTAYDNAGHVEVYVYDPAGRVVCGSCRPSGAPPTGEASLGNHAVNADVHGRIFFQSSDAILPQDTNGRNDVYEYNVNTGSTALISSGVSGNDSNYIGNGVDGNDVYFYTTDALASNDHVGGIYKVYDARVDGVDLGSAPVSPKCTGEGCRGPQAPDPEPVGSATTQVGGKGSRPPVTAPASKLSVSGAKSVTGTTAHLSAKVSGAGRLRVSGSGVVAVSVRTSRAAGYGLTVKLTKFAVARLKRTHRLVVSTTVRFTPRAGATRSERVRLTFKVASKKKGH